MSENVTVRVRVTFVMEADCGPWGPECRVEDLHEVAVREARDAAQRVIVAAAEHAHTRLRVEGLSNVSYNFNGPVKP